VLASWAMADTASAPWTGPAATAVSATNERTIEVRFTAPWLSPFPLADPALAVHRPAAGERWPIGTGAWRPQESGTPLVATPAFGARLPVLMFRRVAAGDDRDALDEGTDVLVARDPAVVAYAATQPELVGLPLPWDRTYVLLQPWRARVETGPLDLPADHRSELEEAVRVEARPATGPFWWDDVRACGRTTAPPASHAQQGAWRVAYHRADRTARDLADRLVAIEARRVRAPGDRPMVSAGLSEGELAGALHAGVGAGFVLALPRAVLDPCAAARQLDRRAPWVAAIAGGPAQVMVPLVETRARLIARRGVGGITMDWDATPHLTPPP